jgi:hypothetical protein
MAEELFRVILKGYSPGKGEYYIEQDLAKLFNITPEKAKELFSSSPTTIREKLSFEQANHFKNKLEATGASCEVESMRFDTSGLSLE